MAERFFIVDVDERLVVSNGFDSESAAEDAAANRWGDDWWTNETPYAVWPESDCGGCKKA